MSLSTKQDLLLIQQIDSKLSSFSFKQDKKATKGSSGAKSKSKDKASPKKEKDSKKAPAKAAKTTTKDMIKGDGKIL